MFLFASPISSLICLILKSLPDWTLSMECSFWSLKYLKRACLTWLNNFTVVVKLLDSSSWYTMWSWMKYWAVKVVVCWFSTTMFLLTMNSNSTWAWPCASISKILKEFPKFRKFCRCSNKFHHKFVQTLNSLKIMAYSLWQQ